MTLNLTPAQAKVLEAWAENGRLKGAARKLGLSAKTVEHHVGIAVARNGLPNSGLLLVRFVRDGAVVRQRQARRQDDRPRVRRYAADRFDAAILEMAARPHGATSPAVAKACGIALSVASHRLSALLASGRLSRISEVENRRIKPYIYKAVPNGNKD